MIVRKREEGGRKEGRGEKCLKNEIKIVVWPKKTGFTRFWKSKYAKTKN